MRNRAVSAIVLAAFLSGCGGGGGSSSGGGGPISAPAPTPAPTPTPTPPATTTCSLASRQDWVAAQINEWYLFPDLLATNVNASSFNNLDDYVDALVAPARAQRRDRFFTYVTSIAEENAFNNSGQTAGFGFRLATDPSQTRLFIAESFENTPATDNNVDRGAEVLAIGTTPQTLRTIDQIAREDGGSLGPSLGPDTVGTSRSFQVRDGAGTRTVTLTKRNYDIQPVSTRYGVRILNDGGKKVGYVNLRTFISTADAQLRNAFTQFRADGVTEVIVDVRYNGGGLVRIAELFGDLLGGNRATSDVFSRTTFRPSKSSFDESRNFAPQPQSIAATKIVFIGTGGTASASELVANSFIPYLGNNIALVGTNTFGKPVGQIALDRAACDDRLRVVAFATQNRDRQGEYFNGLASVLPRTCQAGDDFTRPLGDPSEASVSAALGFLAGRSCTPISSGGATASASRFRDSAPYQLLSPDRPSVAQREVPGLF
ncbi:S41 family peptidase [Sphingomonas sp. FW199]|uniref:S41 family peptidase n=1 Tax=Sphingomonas sp. FW199 TaxID=3400217 RepID=UPI003CFAA67B